jgi:hypothetical protein
MDMTGKWGIGENRLLIGVDNSNKLKLKFTGLDTNTTYNCTIKEQSTATTTSPTITNNVPFDIESNGNTEMLYTFTLKDASGNEDTYTVTGFPKEFRDTTKQWLNWFTGGFVGYTFPLGNYLLKNFITYDHSLDQPPGCTVNDSVQDVTESKLTHNCGASFNSATKQATIKKLTFDKTSAASQTISNNRDFVVCCLSARNLNDTALKKEFDKKL